MKIVNLAKSNLTIIVSRILFLLIAVVPSLWERFSATLFLAIDNMRTLIYFLMLLTQILQPVLASSSVQPSLDFESQANQAFLLDYNTGTVLYSKNGDIKMVPSSMSKLMTIYILFQKLKDGAVKLEDEFAVSTKAWKMEGSRTFLNLSSKVKVEDLLKGIVVQSGNDASVALAEGLAGDESFFANDMNQTALKLGLQNSFFVNSTGWPDDNHLMSAADLATLASALLRDFPEYYHYFAQKSFGYNGITQHNRNDIIGINGVDGLKTGCTEKGGYGVVVSALKGERRLIAVVNGLASSNERSTEAMRLLLYGFNNFESKLFAKPETEAGQLPVINGSMFSVPVTVAHEVIAMLPKSDLDSATASIEYQTPVNAPIKKGQHLGELRVYHHGQVIKTAPVFALSDVDIASFITRSWRYLTNLWVSLNAT